MDNLNSRFFAYLLPHKTKFISTYRHLTHAVICELINRVNYSSQMVGHFHFSPQHLWHTLRQDCFIDNEANSRKLRFVLVATSLGQNYSSFSIKIETKKMWVCWQQSGQIPSYLFFTQPKINNQQKKIQSSVVKIDR